jgi:hypothetical protein
MMLTEEEVNEIRAELDNYTVEGDLRREVGLNIKRLKDLGCYRGIRHRRSFLLVVKELILMLELEKVKLWQLLVKNQSSQ